jgi:hypothetical protein
MHETARTIVVAMGVLGTQLKKPPEAALANSLLVTIVSRSTCP